MRFLILLAAAPLFAQDDGLSFSGPLKDVAVHIERLGEVKISVDPAVADVRVEFRVDTAAGPSDVVHAFDRTLEALEMALVARDEGYEVLRFQAETAKRAPRMEVGVAEGSVDLVGEWGRVGVSEGQESRIDPSGKPAPATPTDREALGAWRETPLSPAPSALAKVPLPALRIRRIGTSARDGRRIVEYSLPAVETADGVVVEVEPTKVVLADGDDVLVPVRVRLR